MLAMTVTGKVVTAKEGTETGNSDSTGGPQCTITLRSVHTLRLYSEDQVPIFIQENEHFKSLR